MRFFIPVLLIGISPFGFIGEARAQLSNSEGSALWVASRIAADGEGSVADYLDYAGRLAKTMSQFPASVQEKIFGFLPPSGVDGGNNAQNGAPLPNVPATTPAAVLANSALTSGEVFDALLKQSPLADKDLLKLLEREPALDKEHLNDLLHAQGKISNGTLVSALASSKLKLPPADLKALLISQSPLDRVVRTKVTGTSNLSSSDIAEVLAAQ
jgi:hypothetical protein